MKTIDIVLPVYNEEPGLVAFDEALFRVLGSLESSYQFKVIYVLDRSTDDSLGVLTRLARAQKCRGAPSFTPFWASDVAGGGH
jgi:glycosyltransferase involved in cell wall biosynthesis